MYEACAERWGSGMIVSIGAPMRVSRSCPKTWATEALTLMIAPSFVLNGTAWQDSTAYTLCRDGVPLRVEAVRRYVAESALMRDGVVHVVVVRRSRVMLEGTGVQFGDTVRIIGGGSSTVRLLLPLSGGAMTGEGEGALTLELRGRRRTQRLTQESRLVISAP